MKEGRIKRAAVVCLLGGFLCMGTTTAYFSDHEETVNILEPGHNTTKVEEDFPSPSPKPPDTNPDYKKTVWVSNTGGANPDHAVIRAFLFLILTLIFQKLCILRI